MCSSRAKVDCFSLYPTRVTRRREIRSVRFANRTEGRFYVFFPCEPESKKVAYPHGNRNEHGKDTKGIEILSQTRRATARDSLTARNRLERIRVGFVLGSKMVPNHLLFFRFRIKDRLINYFYCTSLT